MAQSSIATPPSIGWWSAQLAEQFLRLLQIGGIEALGKPAVDRREKIAGFSAAALVAAEPGEAHGGAQFPELGPLLLGDAQGFAIQLLGRLGMPLPQQQLAFVPIKLGGEPALSCPFGYLQSLVQQGHGLFGSPCHLTCPSQEGDM